MSDVKGFETARHARGESVFLDDLPLPEGTLHAAVLASPLAHGRVVQIDTARALASPGVARVLTAADVPGENRLGPIVMDETLFAQDEVCYRGQSIALVVAATAAAWIPALRAGRTPPARALAAD